MLMLIALAFFPAIAGVIVGIAVRARPLRDTPPFDARLRAATIFAGAFPLLVLLLDLTLRFLGVIRVGDDLGVRAALPLATGIVSILALAIPPVPHRDSSSTTLARRRVLAFASPRWIWVVIALAVVAAGAIITLGSASRLDDDGRFTQYEIVFGTRGPSASTTVFGWYYSAPSSVLLCTLLAVTAIVWLMLPRRPWDSDAVMDAAVRRTRGSNVGRAAAAALLVHLAVVLHSAAGTARLAMSTNVSEVGTVWVGTPFAAVSPILYALSSVCVAAGVACGVVIALVAVPSRRTTAVPA